VIVSGMHLPELVGTRFCIQGVEFEGVQECKPCRWMDRVVADGAQEFMKAEFRGGLRARILTDGVIECTADVHEP
jgi:MOSC domain-containing protein YiiM